MFARLRLRQIVRLGLILTFVYMAVNLISGPSEETTEREAIAEKQATNAKEQLKLRRLHEYQKVIFKNNNRPGT